MKTAIGILFSFVAIVAFIAVQVHHYFVRPDLTEPQALWFYLPYSLLAGIGACIGYFLLGGMPRRGRRHISQCHTNR